jgi:cytochrome c oxidase assembly protein Cox11
MQEPKPMPKSMALMIGLTFAVIGLVALVIGILWIRSTKERLKTMINHTGTVVEKVRVEHPGETANFYPVVEFKTQTGEVFRFEGKTSGPENEYKIGEQVEILYDPQDPQGAMINSWKELWFPSIAMMIIGGGMLVLGIASSGIVLFSKS